MSTHRSCRATAAFASSSPPPFSFRSSRSGAPRRSSSRDLGSTAFYVGGIVEQAVGKSAPWFILGVMLFSYAVRALYIESSAMFVRGGVYRVVKEAMGGTLAKLSVSALLFDYVLTGPISGVSAGSYIAGWSTTSWLAAARTRGSRRRATAAFIAILITVYFWWRNTRGIHESSDDAMTIMKIATVMVVASDRVVHVDARAAGRHAAAAADAAARSQFSDDALGWLKGTVWPSFTAIAILVGFGHSILAMSGEESLAQVYREIERAEGQESAARGHGDLHLQPGLHRRWSASSPSRSFPTRCGRSTTTT